MQRRWVWSIAAAVILLVVAVVAVTVRGGGDSDKPRTHRVEASHAPLSTSTSVVIEGIAAATTSTSSAPGVRAATTTSVTQTRSGSSSATTAPSTASNPTSTTREPRWVTVATLSRDFSDSDRADSPRFDMLTGKGRIVLDHFEVGNKDGNLWWYVMGDDPYHSLAHGNCAGPQAPGSPSTTTPAQTSPKCESGYDATFEIEPGNYSLRVDSYNSKWTMRLQELR
jgi:hypothetical protein